MKTLCKMSIVKTLLFTLTSAAIFFVISADAQSLPEALERLQQEVEDKLRELDDIFGQQSELKNAPKELPQQIDALEKTITAQKAQVDALQKDIQNLEQKIKPLEQTVKQADKRLYKWQHDTREAARHIATDGKQAVAEGRKIIKNGEDLVRQDKKSDGQKLIAQGKELVASGEYLKDKGKSLRLVTAPNRTELYVQKRLDKLLQDEKRHGLQRDKPVAEALDNWNAIISEKTKAGEALAQAQKQLEELITQNENVKTALDTSRKEKAEKQQLLKEWPEELKQVQKRLPKIEKNTGTVLSKYYSQLLKLQDLDANLRNEIRQELEKLKVFGRPDVSKARTIIDHFKPTPPDAAPNLLPGK